MKKRLVMIISALALTVSFAACGENPGNIAGQDAPAPAVEAVVSEEIPTEESLPEEASTETEPPEAEETVSQPGTEEASAPVSEEDNTPVGRHGALSVQGANLTGKNGETVRLCGISTHGIGTFPQYVNEDAFRQFRDEWNLNLIRLAMYTAEDDGYLTGGDKNAIEDTLTRGVDSCIDLGIYCIIDWHILSDGNPNWHKEEAKDFFNRMSQKYGSTPNVIYEICNEPNGVSWDEVKAYADEVIPVIRANAPDAVILVGTPNWCQDIDQCIASPVADPKNVMYTFHFYAETHGDYLQEKLIRAKDQGTPVFVSEFGICEASGTGNIDYDSSAKWMGIMDQYDLSFAVWNLSNKDETSAMIRPDCTKVSGFTSDDLSECGLWVRDTLTEKGRE